MLVYEKWVTENDERVRHLYGTVNNIPSDLDNQLVYKDADGDVLSGLTLPDVNTRYVDDSHGGILQIKNNDGEIEETFVGVNIKKADNSLVNIIPGGSYTPSTKVLKSIRWKKKPTKTTYDVDDKIDLTGAVIEATFESGEKEIVTTDCTFDPADDTTVTAVMTKITASYTYPSTGDVQVTKTADCTITVNT